MSCVVACIALEVVYFEGVPTRPYILWGDRVTWKVLAEYCWSPTTIGPGSFLVLQLFLLESNYNRTG